MSFIPTRLLKPSPVSAVTGPAIVFPFAGRDEVMLVTGGETPHACFLQGAYLGHGFPTAGADRWTGIAVEGIEIEVDQISLFKPAMVQQPLGGVVLTGRGLEIIVAIKDGRGFDNAERVPFDKRGDGEGGKLEVGFTRWMAVVGEGQARREIFSFAATKTGDL